MSFSEKERDRLTDQTTSKQTLEFDDATQARKLFGVQDEYLYIIEKEMDVSIHSRGTQVEIEGTAQHVQLVVDLLEQLEELIDIAKVEGRVKASSVKKIGEIIDQHPEEAVGIIRAWLYSDE